MGDLISRSELLKIIEDEEKDLPADAEKYHVDKNVVDGMKASLIAIKNIITEQETAYDVEKVVEELNCDRCESCRFIEVCAGSVCCTKCHDKIIEIVKQGGDGTDYVCEWKYNEKIEYAKSECGSMDTHRIDFRKFKHCPFCGKKIKVVERWCRGMNVFEKIKETLKERIENTFYRGLAGNKHAEIMRNAYDEAIEIVEQVEKDYNNGWIQCSERLPERNKDVLCWVKSKTISGTETYIIGSCDNGFWFLKTYEIDRESFPVKDYEVVAWQPLPDPYKESEK